MSQAIDFQSGAMLKAYAAVIAAQGAITAFRGGSNTIINAFTPISAWSIPQYSSTQVYQAGQVVDYFNCHYTCEVNGAVGVTPGSDPYRWLLNANQPVTLAGISSDASASQAYLPWVAPAGVSLSWKVFTDGGFVQAAATTLVLGAPFTSSDLNLLFITAGTQAPTIVGTTG